MELHKYVAYKLKSPISLTATSCELVDDSGAPAAGIIQVDSEFMSFNRTGTVLDFELRGLFDSGASEHSNEAYAWVRSSIGANITSAGTNLAKFAAILDENFDRNRLRHIWWTVNFGNPIPADWIALPNGTIYVYGPTIQLEERTYTIGLHTSSDIFNAQTQNTYGVFDVSSWENLYIKDSGFNNGHPFPASPMAAPTVVKTDYYAVSADPDSGLGDADWEQFIRIDAYTTVDEIDEVTVDWDDGSGEVSYPLDASVLQEDEQEGLPTSPARRLSAYFVHEYDDDTPRAIEVKIKSNSTTLESATLNVAPDPTPEYKYDRILFERKTGGAPDGSAIIIHDWLPYGETAINDTTADQNKTYQYRYKLRTLSVDGRDRPAGPAYAESPYSEWSVAE